MRRMERRSLRRRGIKGDLQKARPAHDRGRGMIFLDAGILRWISANGRRIPKMSQTRTKPRKTKTPSPVAPVNGVAIPETEVLTLSEAAAYLRLSEIEVKQLVTDQSLAGRFVGNEWRFLKSAIQDWLKTPPVRG